MGKEKLKFSQIEYEGLGNMEQLLVEKVWDLLESTHVVIIGIKWVQGWLVQRYSLVTGAMLFHSAFGIEVRQISMNCKSSTLSCSGIELYDDLRH